MRPFPSRNGCAWYDAGIANHGAERRISLDMPGGESRKGPQQRLAQLPGRKLDHVPIGIGPDEDRPVAERRRAPFDRAVNGTQEIQKGIGIRQAVRDAAALGMLDRFPLQQALRQQALGIGTLRSAHIDAQLVEHARIALRREVHAPLLGQYRPRYRLRVGGAEPRTDLSHTEICNLQMDRSNRIRHEQPIGHDRCPALQSRGHFRTTGRRPAMDSSTESAPERAARPTPSPRFHW